jgi:hypothetical protein
MYVEAKGEHMQQPYYEAEGAQGGIAWLRARLRLDVTGADAAASVGCSRYETAESLRRSKQFEREKSDEQLLKESQSFDENIHTRAGHANEDPIAKAAARLLFPQDIVLYQPRLAVPCDPVWSWFGASADRLVFRENKLRAILECKFSFGGVPEHPMVEHVFQTVMQMRTIQTRYNYLCYGSRYPCDGPLPVGWTPNYHAPLEGLLGVRVFRLRYSKELWHWSLRRMNTYRTALADPSAPSLDDLLPTMNAFVAHVWFESPQCRTTPCEECRDYHHQRHATPLSRTPLAEYLPPAPKWELILPPNSNERKWMCS